MTRRLAYVVKMFPRFSETFILNELLELERRGFVITVYSLKRPLPGPTHPGLARLRARVVYLPERPVDWLTRGLRAGLRAVARRPSVGLRLLAYVASRGTHQAWKRFCQAGPMVSDLAAHPVEHVHAHFASAPSRVAMFAAQLAGLPFSFTAHAKDIYQQGTDCDLLRDKMRAAAFVVTVSNFNQAHLRSIYGPDVNGTVRRLYNGVNLEEFTPQTPGPGMRPPIVLAIGRLVEKKGLDDLLAAFPAVRAAVPDARLVIVGSGPEEARLRRCADALALSGAVTWAGSESQDRVRERLARAAVFCLPCRVAGDGNRDGLPTVLLEALAAGIPCVSTRVTGVPEILRDGIEGRLVEPGDPPAIARALIGLLRDAEARERMGQAARRRATERFDLRHNVGRLADWFVGVRP